MKKVLMVLALVASLGMSSVALLAQQAVAGTWTLSVQGVSMQMVLTQDGDKISGSIDTPHGTLQVKGDFSKGKLTLVGVSTESHPVQFDATATLGADGSLSGTLSANLMHMEFTASRSFAQREKN